MNRNRILKSILKPRTWAFVSVHALIPPGACKPKPKLKRRVFSQAIYTSKLHFILKSGLTPTQRELGIGRCCWRPYRPSGLRQPAHQVPPAHRMSRAGTNLRASYRCELIFNHLTAVQTNSLLGFVVLRGFVGLKGISERVAIAIRPLRKFCNSGNTSQLHRSLTRRVVSNRFRFGGEVYGS